MAQNIIKSTSIGVVETREINGSSFMLSEPHNIATCACEHTFGRVVTNLGTNKAGLYFYKVSNGDTIAVDITNHKGIKCHKVVVG